MRCGDAAAVETHMLSRKRLRITVGHRPVLGVVFALVPFEALRHLPRSPLLTHMPRHPLGERMNVLVGLGGLKWPFKGLKAGCHAEIHPRASHSDESAP